MNPEEELRRALGSRASDVEPVNDSYARLAQKVTDAQSAPPPWWQAPRLLWLSAAGTVAVVLVVAGALIFADDGEDFVATPVATPQLTPLTPAAAATANDVPAPSALPEPTALPDVTPTDGPTPTPLATPNTGNEGKPDGTIWPRPEMQPFGEWPDSPEDAAQQFVQMVSGWDLSVGEVTMVDPVLFLADVTLQAAGEDGVPIGTATTVRVVGGFDEAGTQNWGVRRATSDLIMVDSLLFDGPADGPLEFVPQGQAHAFEGVVDVVLVEANGTPIARGFVMGGGVELAPITGSVTMTDNEAGPGYGIFADLGGLGVPSAMTIIPIDLPAVAPSSSCSGAGLDQPGPNVEIPVPVEEKRQAIAAAAIACDYIALAALTDPAGFSYSFGEGGDPAAFWEDAERFEAEPMRFLVELLNRTHAEDGTAGTTFYVWPEVFLLPWEDVTIEQQDELRPLFDDDDFAFFSDFGGYVSYRLAIKDTGEWTFFIAGD